MPRNRELMGEPNVSLPALPQGGGGGGGTLTSVGLSVPSDVLTVSGSPVTGLGGVATIGKQSVAPNTVAAGPAAGGNAAWGFRSLVRGDLPGGVLFDDASIALGPGLTISAEGMTAGFLIVSTFATIATVNGASVNASVGFAGPGAGITGLNAGNLASGTVPTARLGSGSATAGTFLAGNSTWVAYGSAALLAAGAANGVATLDGSGHLTAAQLPMLTHANVSDFDTQVRTTRLDQMAPPITDLSLNGQVIVDLADPIADQEAATKNYVDAAAVLNPRTLADAGAVPIAPPAGHLTLFAYRYQTSPDKWVYGAVKSDGTVLEIYREP